jgi:hypothetical protein
MVSKEPNPSVRWDALIASTDVRERFRYKKHGRMRTYSLRVSDDGAELWVSAGKPGAMLNWRRMARFDEPGEAVAYLDDVEKTLRLGGWTDVGWEVAEEASNLK